MRDGPGAGGAQLLSVTGRELSLANLRYPMRGARAHAKSDPRSHGERFFLRIAPSSVGATPWLEHPGLRLDLRAGSVRPAGQILARAPLRPLREALVAVARPEGSSASTVAATSPLSDAGLEVLACGAFKQSLFLDERNVSAVPDKRTILLRLQPLGLVDCQRTGEMNRLV